LVLSAAEKMKAGFHLKLV